MEIKAGGRAFAEATVTVRKGSVVRCMFCPAGAEFCQWRDGRRKIAKVTVPVGYSEPGWCSEVRQNLASVGLAGR